MPGKINKSNIIMYHNALFQVFQYSSGLNPSEPSGRGALIIKKIIHMIAVICLIPMTYVRRRLNADPT